VRQEAVQEVLGVRFYGRRSGSSVRAELARGGCHRWRMELRSSAAGQGFRRSIAGSATPPEPAGGPRDRPVRASH